MELEDMITTSQLAAFMEIIDDQANIQNSIMEEQLVQDVMLNSEDGTLVKEEVESTLSPQDEWGGVFHTATDFYPPSEEWSGPLDFSMDVNSDSVERKSWRFSSQLNKIFICMNSSLPVRFKCHWGEPNLFVRALAVFMEPDQVRKPVERCVYHLRADSATGLDFPAHLVRCEDLNSCYLEDPVSLRLSVVAPLGTPAPGTDHVVLQYKFLCKTSCIGGMNRRPIQVIFTLERHTGEVLGRAAVKVRICSCTKRDMKKEEEMAAKYGVDSVSPAPNSKVAKTDRLHSKRKSETMYQLKKKKMLESDVCLRSLLIYSSKNVFKETAALIRNNLYGAKMLQGQALNLKELENLAYFNSVIDEDVPNEQRED